MIITLVIIAVIILLLYLKCRLELNLTTHNFESKYYAKLSILGGMVKFEFSSDKPIKKAKKQEKKPEEAAKHFYISTPQIKELLKPIKELLARLYKKLKIEHFYLDLTYGTGDPMKTGILYGAIYGLQGSLYALLYDKFTPKKWHFNLSAVYDKADFAITHKSAYTMRPLQILIIVLRVFIRYRRLLQTILKQNKNENKIYKDGVLNG